MSHVDVETKISFSFEEAPNLVFKEYIIHITSIYMKIALNSTD